MTLEFLIGVVILVWAVAFICAWIYYHGKARKQFRLYGRPVNHGHILKDACGVACVVGFICCMAEAKAEAAQTNQNNNSGGGGGGGGDVEAQQPFMSQPMPSYQPQGMDWTPVNSAAADPIQVSSG